MPAGDIRPTYCPNRVVSAAGCDASRAWSGAVLLPLSLRDIYSISGEFVLGRR